MTKKEYHIDISDFNKIPVLHKVRQATKSAVKKGVHNVGNMTKRSKILTVFFLILSIVSYVAIPSYADTFGQNITEPYYVWMYLHDPGVGILHEPAGIFSMPDLTTGQQGITAYCIDISQNLNWKTTFTNGPVTSNQIAYILNNYRLNNSDPGALSNPDWEAAAIQVAIWYFSDHGTWPVAGTNAAIVNRAQEIVNAANAYATSPQADVISVNVSGAGTLPTNPNATATIKVETPGGAPVANKNVNLVVSGATFANGSTTISENTDGNGNISVPIQTSNIGTATVTATTTTVVPAGLTLIPADPYSQKLVLASQISLGAEGSGSMNFVGVGVPRLTKSVIDTSNNATTNGTETVQLGDKVEYNMTYANNGLATLNNVSIVDNLPNNGLQDLTQITNSLSNSIPFSNNNGILTWSVGNLNPGQSGTVSFYAVAPTNLNSTSETLCNVATMEMSGVNNVNSNSACITMTSSPGLSVSKLVNNETNATASLGSLANYQIKVTNTGSENLSKVQVEDSLVNNGLTGLGDIQVNQGMGVDNQGVIDWNIPLLPVGSSVTVGFSGTLPDNLQHGTTTCFSNVATANAGGISASSNTAKICVTPPNCTIPSATIGVSGSTTLTVGDNTTYTVNVDNTGNTVISSPTVNVSLPSGWSVSSSSVNGNEVNGNYQILLPDLKEGASQTISLTVAVPQNVSIAPGTVQATLQGNDGSTVAGCPLPQVDTSGSFITTILPQQKPTPPAPAPVSQMPSTQVQGIQTGPNFPVPDTGSSYGFFHYSVTGLMLILAGLSAYLGTKRRRDGSIIL